MNYRFAPFELRTGARLLLRDGRPLDLPRRVFDCLLCLIERRDRAVGRDELIGQVWGRSNVSDNQLAQTVLRARRLLNDDGDAQRCIRTVAGFGYAWVAAVDCESEPVLSPGLQTAQPAAVAGALDHRSDVAAAAAAPAAATAQRPAGRARWTAAALAALVATGGFALLALPERTGQAPAAERLLAVLPAEVADPERARWARHGLMALVAARLAEGGLRIQPLEHVLAHSGVSTSALDEDAVHDLRGRLGSQALLGIEATPAGPGQGWRVALRLYEGEHPRLLGEAQGTELIEAAEAATHAALAQLGGRVDSSHSADPAPLASARRALRRHDFDGARAALARLPAAHPDAAEVALLQIEIALAGGELRSAGQRIAALLGPMQPPQAVPPAGAERAVDSAEVLAPLVLNDPLQRARAHLLRNRWARRIAQPEPDAALDELVQQLQRLDAPSVLAQALQARGAREVGAGRIESASRDYAQALRLFSAAGEPTEAASVSSNLALLLMLRGRNTEALQQLRDASIVFREHGDINRLFNAHSSISSLQIGMLRWQEALLSSDAAGALLGLIEDASSRQRHFRPRALVMLGLGRLDEAEALLARAAIEGTRGDANPDTLARQGLYEAQLALAKRDAGRAARAAQQVFEPLYARHGVAAEPQVRTDARDLALLLWVQASVLAAEQSGSAPPALSAQALHLLAHAESVLARVARGRWRLAQADFAAAEEDLRAALQGADEFNRLSRVLLCHEALADLLLAQGRQIEAEALIVGLQARDPGLLQRDYDAAVLALRVRRGGSDPTAFQRALEQAQRLAGQRTLPPSLLQSLPGKEPTAAASAAPAH